MELKTDLKEVSELGQLKLDENKAFRAWLKTQDPQLIADTVDRLGRAVAQQIDCTSCANCCRALTITPSGKDIKRLSDGIGMEPFSFKQKYLKKDHEGDLVFKQRPCPFLKESKCSVYHHRPETCRSYPHLEKVHMAARGWYIVDNTIVCPIVFNTYEALKEHFHFMFTGANRKID